MGKYVKVPDTDILYGSAMLFDPAQHAYVRQDLPQLLDCLYADAGTLGMVMNVLDPARRAVDLSDTIRDKIFEVRRRVARKVISGFGTASVAGGFIPFNQLLVTPGLLASMVFVLFKMMGRPMNKAAAKQVSVELLKTCGQELGAEFLAVMVAEGLLGAIQVLGPVGFALGALGSMAGLGYYRYRRTAILGEVTVEFIRHGCTWDGTDRHRIFQECKERAMQHYMRLRKSDE
jgi:uncharacterized protein (DUF697 family)